MNILFENACVITMEDKLPVVENAFVAVSGRKIAYVGKVRPQGSFERVINAAGKVLMPGLINTHTHIPMTLFRGLSDDCELDTWLKKHIWPAEDKLTDDAVRNGAYLAVAEMISTGTTSFSDSYFFVDAIADVVEDTGIRANLSRSIVGEGGDGYCDMPSVREELALIDRVHMKDGGRIRADVSIHAEYTSGTDCRIRTAEIARERGLILQIHMSETEKENLSCAEKYGKTPARLFYDEGLFCGVTPLLAHCCHLTDEDMEIMQTVGASVAHCPISNLKLASGIAEAPKMINRGINLGLGTDSVASNNSHDMFEEIKLFATLYKGILQNPTVLNAYDALKAATVNGAIAQGRDDCGKIREGFEADIIMLDFDRIHLTPCHNVISNAVYSAKGSDVVMTMVAGKILYENGAFSTIDIEKTMSLMKDSRH